MNKLRTGAFVLLLALFILPLVSATRYSTTTWAGTYNWIYNGTKSNYSAVTIGTTTYHKTLGTFSFTNSSNSANCSKLAWRLEYDGVNTSEYLGTSRDMSAISAAVVRPYFNTTVSDVTSGCTVTGVQLTWQPNGAVDADLIEGLPNVGSDVGSFMKNLAPGIGSFIIIIGVLGAIAGIIWLVVTLIKGRIGI